MIAFGHYLLAHLDTLRLEFWQLFVGGIANGLLYGMIAVGYTLVYGVLRQINFAHSEVFMVGGFAGYFVMRWLVPAGHVPSGMESVGLISLGVVTGALASGIIAMLLERVAYKSLRKRHAPQLAYLISAIGSSYFLFNLAGKEFGHLAVGTPQPYTNSVVFHIFNAPVLTYYLIVLVVGLVMFVGVDRMLSKSRLGRGIRAVAQDAETASLMGINIDRTIMITFIVGGVLGGAAGFLYAMQFGVVYTMGFVPALKAFTAAVLGGIGNLRGAMIGGLVLGIFESLSVAFVQAAYTDVVSFGILVLVLLVRPTGILGERIGRSA